MIFTVSLYHCRETDLQWAERSNVARHQWLMAIILAIQEAEIRRSSVQSQFGKYFYETLSRKHPAQTK
jgi:hypothetical protein